MTVFTIIFYLLQVLICFKPSARRIIFPVMLFASLTNASDWFTFDFGEEINQELHHLVNPSLLDSILNPLINKNCYVILRNHLNTDLILSNIPTLSMNWILTDYTEFLKKGKLFGETAWISSKTAHNYHDKSDNLNMTTDSCNSRFFIMKPLTEEFCLHADPCAKLRRQRWALDGRPGNCNIQIDFILPATWLVHLYWQPLSEYTTSNWEPTMPQIHLLLRITQETSTLNNDLLRNWNKWKQCKNLWKEASMVINYVVHIKVGTQATYEIYKVEFDQDKMSSHVILPAEWNKLKGTKLKDFDLANRDFHKWDMSSSKSPGFENTRISPFLSECVIDVSHRSYLEGESGIETRTGKMDRANAHILQLIMGNFSYIDQYGYLCIHSGKYDSSYYTLASPATYFHIETFNERKNRTTIPSMVISNPLLNIRFVVCGDRGKSSHAFHQLTNAFEIGSWLGIIIALLAGAYCLSCLRRDTISNPISVTVLEIFKVIVEQGNPFEQIAAINATLKYIIISILLTGIVLSNSYKNTNVYNMVQPRLPLRYQTIEQLLQGNFQFYSRLAMVIYRVKYKYGPRYSVGKSREWQTRYFVTHVHEYHRTLDSKISELDIQISYNLEFHPEEYIDWTKYTYRKKSTKDPGSVNEHPAVPEKLLSQLSNVKRSGLRIGMPKSEALKSKYTKWEEWCLLSELRKCTRMVVFLPEVVAKIYKMLFQATSNDRLDIGTEVIKRNMTGISFKGMIKRSTQARHRAIQQAGILMRWEKLYRFDLNKEASNDRNQVTPAKLSGHILVIFTVFFVGNILSIVAYCTELCLLFQID